MTQTGSVSAISVERTCALTAVALSDGRRSGARLMSGQNRCLAFDPRRALIAVPYPTPSSWSSRTLTSGIALQCAPSKERVAQYRLDELSSRQRRALSIVEGESALGWVAERWPGLLPELRRALPALPIGVADLDGDVMLSDALSRASARIPLPEHELLGALPTTEPAPSGVATALRRMYGRMPWSTRRNDAYRMMSVPVGGAGGVRNPNLPPPSRPEDDDVEIRPAQRAGVPYPEWNMWRQEFLPNHVAVLERKHTDTGGAPLAVSADLRRWFQHHTHRAMRNRLEDGSDLDIDAYVEYFVDTYAGEGHAPLIFRDLLPAMRDVTTALLLDGSSSLGIHRGRTFELELACADALSRAMAAARERHGVFVFSGNTRHRVDVLCLKDFSEPRFVVPSRSGLVTAGYTRLGAALRHLTSRLLEQPSERRLLIIVGDGLISDEGYEGRYAWADTAHAVEEAAEAGVAIYYVGLGRVRVDPLPEVFGPKRSRRIHRIEQLPVALAHIHRELVTA